jgi:hypothetical protein
MTPINIGRGPRVTGRRLVAKGAQARQFRVCREDIVSWNRRDPGLLCAPATPLRCPSGAAMPHSDSRLIHM